MGAARRYQENLQNLQNVQIPAICDVCGSTGATLLVEEQSDNWTDWRPAYTNEFRRFLCVRCSQTVKPSLCHLLEKGDLRALRALPLTNDLGEYSPNLTKKQLSANCNYYPSWALGERNIRAIWQSVTYISDCQLLVLVPDKGQEYYMDLYLEKFGRIYTSFSLKRRLPKFYLLHKVVFHSFYDEDGRSRTDIRRGNKLHEHTN